MKFGLFATNAGACASPKVLTRVVKAAEKVGFESLWNGEHVVLPDPLVPPSPLPPETALLDPIVALTFAAAETTRIRLATGILILPQRNPLVLAKQLASLDVLSGGRLIVGIGVGYLKPEFDALGIPFTYKGARTDEYLRAMIAVWTMDHPEFQGRFATFRGIQSRPRPQQRPHPTIVVGGHSAPAFHRAARFARGWYGFALDLDQTRKCLNGLRNACLAESRRFDDLEISVTPAPSRESPHMTRDLAKRYADLGVHRLVLYAPMGRGESALMDAVTDAEMNLIGKL